MNLPQYELNISDYLRIIRKRKSIIIVSFVLVTALSLFYVSKQKAWYEAVTTVKIAERKTIAGLLAEWIAYNPGNIMESETKLITGFPVMKKVVLRLKMVDENAADEDIFNAIAQVQGGVSAKTFKDTNIIEIIARSDNAKKAMELAIYIEKAVRDFTRYHKYTIGTDMRNLSRDIVSLVIKANSRKDKESVAQMAK